MNLRQLEYFMAIAEEHQLTAAARRLHITQPPLSYELASLEKELGTKLVVRGPRSTELTDAGKLLYVRAAQIVDATNSAQHEVKSFAAGLRGTLSVGVASSCNNLMPSAMMQSFLGTHPEVTFDLYEGDTPHILDMLEAGTVEVGVARTPFLVGEFECLYKKPEPLVAIMPQESVYGKAPDHVSLEELSLAPIIVDRCLKQLVSNVFNARGLTLKVICTTEDVRTTLEWATRKLGVGLLPHSCITDTKGVTIKTIDCEKFSTKLAVVWRRGRYLSPLVENFVRLFN